MPTSESHDRRPVPRPRGRLSRPRVVAAAIVLVLLAVPATLAAAHGNAPRAAAPATVRAEHNATVAATIVVDSRGRTLYTLSGETTHHLKCTTAQCLTFWPPATVGSAHIALHVGAGVQGGLGRLRRGGVVQLTLRGAPLYRFTGDLQPEAVAGEGIASFGGVWHVVTATGAAVPAPTGAQGAPTVATTTTSSTAAAAAPDVSTTSTSVAATTSSSTSAAPTPRR